MTTIRNNLYTLKKLGYTKMSEINNSRIIQVRKMDLIKIDFKQNIDVTSLDIETLSNYYSLMPGRVLLSKDINSTEKMLYSELMSLTNKYGFAFISNSKLSQLVNLSERQLIRSLNNLLKYGFINYGKDIKSKRLIYVTYHFRKDYSLHKKSYDFQVIENDKNEIITVKNVFKKKIIIDDDIDRVLDELYKKM